MLFAPETWSESFMTLGSILSEGRVNSRLFIDNHHILMQRLIIVGQAIAYRKIVQRPRDRQSCSMSAQQQKFSFNLAAAVAAVPSLPQFGDKRGHYPAQVERQHKKIGQCTRGF